MRRYATVVGVVTLLSGLVLSGCASTNDTENREPAGDTAGTTVSTMQVPGLGASLVDSSGRTSRSPRARRCRASPASRASPSSAG